MYCWDTQLQLITACYFVVPDIFLQDRDQICIPLLSLSVSRPIQGSQNDIHTIKPHLVSASGQHMLMLTLQWLQPVALLQQCA